MKNTTIKIVFIVEKLQFLASTKSHFLFFSRGGALALINTSTGLENELPEMMPVWDAYGFAIYTSRTDNVGS